MKKTTLIVSLLIVVGLVTWGAYALGQNNNHSDVPKSDYSQTKSKENTNKTATKKTTSNDSANADKNDQSNKTSAATSTTNNQASDYNALPQKIKLALLAHTALPNNYGTNYRTHYSVFMGDKDKIVIYDDGEGAGGTADHTVMYTDNHNGTYTVSYIESSAPYIAAYNANNSYWKAYKTVSEADMMNDYQQNKDEIKFTSDLVDLSNSAKSFTFVPTNQTSLPNK
ncbi:hypothetical protein R4B61_01845 [Fructilactobacillus vespulae]|uniref:hypothetical protein n=1 Tax=Fructilactobacillus vespulae TaxID=1249630 RepID=UPI0039B588B7